MNNSFDNNNDNSNTQNNWYQPSETKYGPYDAPSQHKPENSSRTPWGKIVAVGVGCSILGGMIGVGAMNMLDHSGSSNIFVGNRNVSELNINQVNTDKELTPAELYAQNVNSTVGITTSVTTNYFGYQTTKAAAGSGFIYSDDGYILTNFHVINNASEVSVTMYDGTSYDAEIVGYDESNDIAVLKIDAQGLTPVVLGDSDSVNVGDTVVAIGNPLGELTFSLTSGVVSALNREVTFSGGVSMDLIQTDCAINSGNSGGALFNSYGEVIGITNAKFSSNAASGAASIDNIGFAIPMNSVQNIVNSIIETGYVTKPFVGITVMSVSNEAQSYGLPAGASVQEIAENSPAEKAGLQPSDIITKANDVDIKTSNDLVRYIADRTPGDKIELTVFRGGKELNITLTIGERTKPAVEESKQ